VQYKYGCSSNASNTPVEIEADMCSPILKEEYLQEE